jgi:predicted membrane channel-forming protein YqfA (hemolysin III family)
VIHSLAVVLLVLTATVAIDGIVTTLRDKPTDRRHAIAVGLVEAVLVVQALIGAVRVLGGHHLAETSTFLIYLAVSVCVLPVGLQFARAEPTRWGGTVVAVAAIAVGVAELRLLALWGSPVG